ncbi:hypothetical protein [Streptococcus massiliensis]|uniref:Phage protein n=1 Tax=Streptococcus massiliensis TaxID=313439 RepID=A0A380KXQ1_9STRE|nr:hypothetical protein [Streptococcus massiliensis]SUN76733.1 Uncharacterised protein [Streptococcus massiliensis]
MDKQYLQEKLAGMRSKYIESVREGQFATDLNRFSDKKMQKIKKKLVSLEMERCHKQIEHRDCSKIDEKIMVQKSLFEQCRRRG